MGFPYGSDEDAAFIIAWLELNRLKGIVLLASLINELDNKSYESDKNLKGYFEGLKEEIANLPKPKYYDDNISELKKNLEKYWKF